MKCIAVEKDYDNEANDWRVNTYIGAGRNENRTWLSEAQRQHLPVDEAWPSNDWDGYQLVIIAHHKITDADYVQKLKRYVKDGGTLVLGAQSGSKTIDNHIVATPLPGLLAELAGVEVEDWTMVEGGKTFEAAVDEEIVTLGVFSSKKLRITTAQTLAVWRTDDSLLSGGVAIGLNKFGKGQVIYIGGYCNAAAVENLLGWLVRSLQLQPSVTASNDVECVQRQHDQYRYTCLLNHSSKPQPVSDLRGGVEIISGRKIGRALTLEPLEVAIIQSPC